MSILIILSMPLQMKYPPNSVPSSPTLLNSSIVIWFKGQIEDLGIIGIWPTLFEIWWVNTWPSDLVDQLTSIINGALYVVPDSLHSLGRSLVSSTILDASSFFGLSTAILLIQNWVISWLTGSVICNAMVQQHTIRYQPSLTGITQITYLYGAHILNQMTESIPYKIIKWLNMRLGQILQGSRNNVSSLHPHFVMQLSESIAFVILVLWLKYELTALHKCKVAHLTVQFR